MLLLKGEYNYNRLVASVHSPLFFRNIIEIERFALWAVILHECQQRPQVEQTKESPHHWTIYATPDWTSRGSTSMQVVAFAYTKVQQWQHYYFFNETLIFELELNRKMSPTQS